MKKFVREGLIYLAGILTLPAVLLGYRAVEKIGYWFDPSYTGIFVRGTVVSENKPADKFGMYELELRVKDGQIRTLQIDCGRKEPIFNKVYGQAKGLERIIIPSDIVEFQVTGKGEPTWLWDSDRTSCPVD